MFVLADSNDNEISAVRKMPEWRQCELRKLQISAWRSGGGLQTAYCLDIHTEKTLDGLIPTLPRGKSCELRVVLAHLDCSWKWQKVRGFPRMSEA